MKPFLVYALKEPETGEIRYFGITCQKMERRFATHLRAKPYWSVSSWIHRLKETGKKPAYEILIKGLTAEEAGEEEIALIKWGRETKMRLLNSASGGQHGPVGMEKGPMSEEQKQHLSRINTGKILTEEHKQKIAQAVPRGADHVWFGKHRDPEMCRKISESLSGEKNPCWGKKRPEVARVMQGTKRSNNTSGFVGVHFNKEKLLWQAYINFQNKRSRLGYFRTAEDAARAYDQAAINIYGDAARLNFPDLKNDVSR